MVQSTPSGGRIDHSYARLIQSFLHCSSMGTMRNLKEGGRWKWRAKEPVHQSTSLCSHEMRQGGQMAPLTRPQTGPKRPRSCKLQTLGMRYGWWGTHTICHQVSGASPTLSRNMQLLWWVWGDNVTTNLSPSKGYAASSMLNILLNLILALSMSILPSIILRWSLSHTWYSYSQILCQILTMML